MTPSPKGRPYLGRGASLHGGGGLQVQVSLLELHQLGADGFLFFQPARHGANGLQAVSGDGNDNGLFGVQSTLGKQLARHGHGDAAGGFRENPFGLCQQADAIHNFLIANILAGASDSRIFFTAK